MQSIDTIVTVSHKDNLKIYIISTESVQIEIKIQGGKIYEENDYCKRSGFSIWAKRI